MIQIAQHPGGYDQSKFKDRYRFFWKVAEILAPDHTEELFAYIIHSMDDNGDFLRSRFCYWEEPVLKDRNGNYDWNIVLVTAEPGFDFEDSDGYYKIEPGWDAKQNKHTCLKFQLFFGEHENDEGEYSDAAWSAQMGYTYAIRIDMKHGTYTVKEMDRGVI